MDVVRKRLSGTTAFLIASDENVCHKDFSGMTIRQAPGHELEDLYCLAECDYIVGPPSTYSAWAAFYGKKPLYQIDLKDIEIGQFKFNTVAGV